MNAPKTIKEIESFLKERIEKALSSYDSNKRLAADLKRHGADITSANIGRRRRGETEWKVEEIGAICLLTGTHPNYLYGWSADRDRDIPDFVEPRLRKALKLLADVGEMELGLNLLEIVLINRRPEYAAEMEKAVEDYLDD